MPAQACLSQRFSGSKPRRWSVWNARKVNATRLDPPGLYDWHKA